MCVLVCIVGSVPGGVKGHGLFSFRKQRVLEIGHKEDNNLEVTSAPKNWKKVQPLHENISQ